MATILRQIVDELAAVISAAGLPEVDQVRGRMNLDPTGASIDIFPGDPFGSDEERGFGSPRGGYVFTVRLRFPTADHEAGQELALDLMDYDDGLAAELEADQTLNGLASTVEVTGPTGFRRYVDTTPAMLGCEWSVKVLPETS